MLKRWIVAAAAAVGCWIAPQAMAQQDKPIKIALIASKTGPSEAYARDTERGLRLGLEYLTQGSMTLLGRKAINLDTPELQRFLAGKRNPHFGWVVFPVIHCDHTAEDIRAGGQLCEQPVVRHAAVRVGGGQPARAQLHRPAGGGRAGQAHVAGFQMDQIDPETAGYRFGVIGAPVQRHDHLHRFALQAGVY